MTPRQRLSDWQFRGLLDALMTYDHPSLTPQDERARKAVTELAFHESQARGFQGWVVAFHDFMPSEGGS